MIIGQYKGYVQNLNMRGTTLIDFSDNLILIPNIMIIQSVVENQTANPKTGTHFTMSIGYQESITKAQNLIIKSLSEVEGILADPPPSSIVKEFGSTRGELDVRVWFHVKKDREMRIRSKAMIRTKETLLANGFSVPSKSRELIFSSSLKLEDNSSVIEPTETSVNQKVKVQKQAASNLLELDHAESQQDPSAEDMLQQAENNPLPMNVSEKDFLKK